MAEVARVIKEKFPAENVDETGVKLQVLVAETNSLDSTYDGFDFGGERIADEIQKTIDDTQADGKKQVTRFSLVGYSLGGLLSRYLVGILESRHFFDTIKPINFSTFASPHIGVIKTNFFFSRIAFMLGPKMLSRTGPQLWGQDSWSSSGQPLLEVMADPKGIFYQGLAKFERLSLYGSAFGDRTVSYQTALIDPEDPFYDHEKTGMIFNTEEDYPHLLASYHLPDQPLAPPPKPPVLSREYLKTTFSRARLPPIFALRFPLNLVLFALLPVLIPMGLSFAFVKVSLDSSNSRKRLRVLEKDAGFKDRLVNVMKRLDKEVENVIVEIVEDAAEQAVEVDEATGEPISFTVRLDDMEGKDTTTVPGKTISLHTPSLSRKNSAEKKEKSKSRSLCSSRAGSNPNLATTIKSGEESKEENDSGKPVLSELQLRLASSLNTLPFHKYRAYFPGVFSSHAVIISRDVQRFSFHKQGESVLRHWADHFII
ncbi:hypothetical protein FRC19_001527 [Serendipita sp. 401]|nr:hypothetical protein FRC19_001527 [Serendipita sp. 401]